MLYFAHTTFENFISKENVIMDREHYMVEGIGNQEVKTQIKNALEKIDGVNNVCVDMARGSVEVIYNNPATPEEIKNCIENTGCNIK